MSTTRAVTVAASAMFGVSTLLYSVIRFYARIYRIKSTPSARTLEELEKLIEADSKIAQFMRASGTYVKLEGRAKCSRPLKAPVSGESCVYWSVKIAAIGDKPLSTQVNDTIWFLQIPLSDDSKKYCDIEVLMDGAEIHAMNTIHQPFAQEEVIPVGQRRKNQVFVMGYVERLTVDGRLRLRKPAFRKYLIHAGTEHSLLAEWRMTGTRYMFVGGVLTSCAALLATLLFRTTKLY